MASQLRLKNLGEDEVIRRLTQTWPSKNKRLLYGAGQDCAVLRLSHSKHVQLFKTDSVVEEVHFTSQEKPERVGWKALARCVSDVAAMGGVPTCALITLGAPAHTSFQRVSGFYKGIEKCAKAYQIDLVGGETTRASQLFLSIALLGQANKKKIVTRKGACPGDVICVTGTLGGSRRGKHLDFKPRLAEGRWLVTKIKPSAMMDISDGLGKDLPRLCRESGVGFEVEEVKIPLTRGATVKQAWDEGEDFELLFTIKPKAYEKLLKLWPFSTRITAIGKIIKKKTQTKFYGGFDHFKK